jgi:hypothetical protein
MVKEGVVLIPHVYLVVGHQSKGVGVSQTCPTRAIGYICDTIFRINLESSSVVKVLICPRERHVVITDDEPFVILARQLWKVTSRKVVWYDIDGKDEDDSAVSLVRHPMPIHVAFSNRL